MSQLIHRVVGNLTLWEGTLGGMNALEGLLLALVAVSATLYLLMAGGFLWSMGRAAPAPAPKTRPLVSILKPLAGVDDELELNLASFEALDYPDYEILLGVASVVGRDFGY